MSTRSCRLACSLGSPRYVSFAIRLTVFVFSATSGPTVQFVSMLLTTLVIVFMVKLVLGLNSSVVSSIGRSFRLNCIKLAETSNIWSNMTSTVISKVSTASAWMEPPEPPTLIASSVKGTLGGWLV